jgi:hypothetical protein
MIETTTRMPTGITLGVQCFPKGWAGHAQASAKERHESLEQWRAEYPDLAVEPHVNRAKGRTPFVTYSWYDERYWPTPEAAFAAILERVLADVRPQVDYAALDVDDEEVDLSLGRGSPGSGVY